MEEENRYEPQQYVSDPMVNMGGPEKRRGMAIASLVLGVLSLLCCCIGIGLIPAIVGAILGLIALISGEGKARVMGGIGLALSAIGLLISLYIIVSLLMAIRWENFTWENFSTFQYIDPDNEEQMRQWLQQFFNVDISSSSYYSYYY